MFRKVNTLLFSSLLNMITALAVVSGRWSVGRRAVGRWSMDLIKPCWLMWIVVIC